MKKRLLVVGGGAAGMFCAVNAAQLNENLEVVVIEKSLKLLSKVKISGGGRCNLTHACFSVSELVKHYPRGATFLKKAFHHFAPANTIEWFNARGVQVMTEDDGRIFPVSNNSQTIINCILNEAAVNNIEIQTAQTVTGMNKRNNNWAVQFASGKELNADFVLVACGGFPKAEQFNWIKATGHTIVPPVPSLYSFNCPKHPITELMGISLPQVIIKLKGTSMVQSGPILITHWGLSGPAVLKLSAWAACILAENTYQFKITINWIPNFHENSCREKLVNMRTEKPTQKIFNATLFNLPSRFWHFMLNQAGISQEVRWADLTAKSQNALARLLTSFELDINGKTTYKEEFVTAGGVSLSEINSTTMESKLHKGLYFAGEIMDVDGVTGGFNFQHAWTSGFLAASHIASFNRNN